ncbi:PIN domain-containing protein [Frigoriglobus tundricola]|uniref:PIN domain-containing protein n=1 Tax=Frigoriglobus tundricola TaxID=2774151 RepID=A0A6M5YS15_9BACT|nr:hypothetical protein [Frigoriglobus tundricola]QJW95772.1 hypothetical protein FTUN_3326 [Frigoriglobus tundricola]
MIFPIFLPPNRYPPKFVLDVSVAAAWAIPRHYTVYTNRVQFKLLTAAGLVTAAWTFETADRLRLALQRGDTTQSRVDRVVDTLALLPIYVDDEGPFRAWPDARDLARTHAISVHAASAAGVPLFTP